MGLQEFQSCCLHLLCTFYLHLQPFNYVSLFQMYMDSKDNHRAWQVPKLRVQTTLAHLFLYNLAFVPDWPDFNTSSPFDVSSQQQGEDIYVQIKTHIKRYMNKEITYQNFIFNPRENPFLFSTYFCLVFTIFKVQTNNSNENAKNVTHVYKYS